MAKSNSIQIGPGLTGTLTILFVLLKVFGKIDWSWWWVFSPLWISALILVGILTVLLGLYVIAELLK